MKVFPKTICTQVAIPLLDPKDYPIKKKNSSKNELPYCVVAYCGPREPQTLQAIWQEPVFEDFVYFNY